MISAGMHRLEILAHRTQGCAKILVALRRAIDAEHCFQFWKIGADLLDLAEAACIGDQDLDARVLEPIAQRIEAE